MSFQINSKTKQSNQMSNKNNNNNNNKRSNNNNSNNNNNNNSKKSRKDVCDLGKNCPYKKEYQHSLEFSHDEEPQRILFQQQQQQQLPIPPFSGRGHVLGGLPLKPRNNYESNKRNADFNYNNNNNRYQDYENSSNKKQKKNVYFDDVDIIEVEGEERPKVICDICHRSVDFANWDKHAYSHERNFREQDVVSLISPSPTTRRTRDPISDTIRTSIREEQDREYETSMLADLLKTSKLEYEKEKMKKLLEEEEKKLPSQQFNHSTTIDLSDSPTSKNTTTTTTSVFTPKRNKTTTPLSLLSTNNNNNNINSITNKTKISLSPTTVTTRLSTPTLSNINHSNAQMIPVAFRLPNLLAMNGSTSTQLPQTVTTTTIVAAQPIFPVKIPSRIVHTFSSHDTVQTIFTYLTSLPYLQGKSNLELRSVISSDGLNLSQQSSIDCHKTLLEAGITPNIVVVVYDPSI